MASLHLSAPPRTSGLIHRNVRLTSHYAVVDNRLAQHRTLSLTARGLALYLESLPDGASVGIKAITAAVPESELRVTRALRELEAHGYLVRERVRLPNGRLITLTISYNRPGAEPDPGPETPGPRRPPRRDRPGRPPRPRPSPPAPPPPPAAPPPPAPSAAPPRPAPPPPAPPPPAPSAASPAGASAAPPPAPPPAPLAERHRPAAALLVGLRAHEPRLLLAERDVRRLAPGVTAWLDRGIHPDAVRRTLSACLPDDLVHPAGLLAHRLTVLLPPPLPARPPAPDPFQTCDGCDRPFRAPVPGRCRDCRPAAGAAA
ncbi:helix-turn-helix domain-containing protein [Streptomyces sp. NPDC053493]|uniref:helix-turn-helix domain-containing protein n=1 Tax=Streptomyces sp. NPDC053493 TaxID=3365705 RepID=UPI0037CD13D1